MPPVLISAANPGPMTGAGNNTWLLLGPESTLVDAGIGAPEHLARIAQALDGRRLHRVIVTHGHADHASGVPALQAAWPGLEVTKWSQHAEPGWRHLEDGGTIVAGDRRLEVLHTPGHARDHICLWDAGEQAVYSGDLAVQGSSVMIPAGRGGGLAQYLRSLARVAALRPARMYPGHGPVIDEPIALIASYSQHRLDREAQVLVALNAGALSVEDIVDRVYPDLAEALRPAARDTIEAHLEKLREEGRA